MYRGLLFQSPAHHLASAIETSSCCSQNTDRNKRPKKHKQKLGNFGAITSKESAQSCVSIAEWEVLLPRSEGDLYLLTVEGLEMEMTWRCYHSSHLNIYVDAVIPTKHVNRQPTIKPQATKDVKLCLNNKNHWQCKGGLERNHDGQNQDARHHSVFQLSHLCKAFKHLQQRLQQSQWIKDGLHYTGPHLPTQTLYPERLHRPGRSPQ